jgi:F-type H+-transporting ATPase subunit alpha
MTLRQEILAFSTLSNNQFSLSKETPNDTLSRIMPKVFSSSATSAGLSEETKNILTQPRSMGRTATFGDSVIEVSGLRSAGIAEVVSLGERGERVGVTIALTKTSATICLLDDVSAPPKKGADSAISSSCLTGRIAIPIGTPVRATGQSLATRFSYGSAGRVFDVLGAPLDGKEAPPSAGTVPIESPALSVLERRPVTEPLSTGLLAFDALIPLGHGQREALMGDPKTGKTAAALVLAQVQTQIDKSVKLFFINVGQRISQLAATVASLRAAGCLDNTTLVVSYSSDPTLLQTLTPPAGCALAERWARKGYKAVTVYDTLTTHADAYRELSLILRRPPGREGYPADVFYKHASLLERAGAFKVATKAGVKRAGSSTALPILDLDNGDLSAFLPTNLVSITDGQAILNRDLFNDGIKPALDTGLSVSRLGSAVQPKALRAVSSRLKITLTQLKGLEKLADITTDLSDDMLLQLTRGKACREVLKQDLGEACTLAQGTILLHAATYGAFDLVPTEEVRAAGNGICSQLLEGYSSHDTLKKGNSILTDALENNRPLTTAEVYILLFATKVSLVKLGYAAPNLSVRGKEISLPKV